MAWVQGHARTPFHTVLSTFQKCRLWELGLEIDGENCQWYLAAGNSRWVSFFVKVNIVQIARSGITKIPIKRQNSGQVCEGVSRLRQLM